MTYTCFPDQTPFPLPPGVTTPPAAPELIDNGPQLPPNSIEAADDLDLCTLAGLLDSLPDDEVFVPELEDPATPILPPFKEIFYVDAPIRLTGSWFFIPGPVTLDQGAITAVVKAVVFAGAPIGGPVRTVFDVQADGLFTRLTATVKLKAEAEASITAKVKLAAEAIANQALNAGVVFGLTVTKP